MRCDEVTYLHVVPTRGEELCAGREADTPHDLVALPQVA